jgi:S-adenosylmethionine:tRNA ribosyltransferase-isomerase
MYTITDYDYELPQELIAQKPVAQRDSSRLLHLKRASMEVAHHRFADLYHFLSPDDVLVLNNTEVIPGRLYGHKTTGGKVEVLLLDYAGGRADHGRFRGQCLVRSSKPLKPGSEILFDQQLKAVVIEGRNGVYALDFRFQGRFEDLLYRYGKVPLPPYIKRHSDNGAVDDSQAYQTVYASQKGAVAAPTAGLHFTRQLLAQIRSKGVQIIHITLHVGYGTFLPVRVSDIRDHRMHAERFFIPETCADVINHARQQGHRIIAVGTTCARTLEFAANSAGRLVAGSGDCDLYIYPGFEFKIVDGLVTNFHLPQSTLLMLVSAFAGRENILAAYREAIKQKYRFYSYGDAMVIL